MNTPGFHHLVMLEDPHQMTSKDIPHHGELTWV